MAQCEQKTYRQARDLREGFQDQESDNLFHEHNRAARYQQKNPAAYQAMTATMLESARKGYWKPSETQLKQTAQLHADITKESGAACTDFVCNNASLQKFIEGKLSADVRQGYNRQMSLVKNGQANGKVTVLEKQESGVSSQESADHAPLLLIGIILLLLLIVIIVLRLRNGNRR